jgi:hypothetical protein
MRMYLQVVKVIMVIKRKKNEDIGQIYNFTNKVIVGDDWKSRYNQCL